VNLPIAIKRALSQPRRESVERLERAVLQLPQVDLKTTHCLNGGLYARTIFIPAGTVLTGAVHKKDHINVLQGDISVSTDEGMKRLTGHHVLPTKAGMKRAGFAHADTYWTTICPTDETDLEEIEADLVEEAERLQTRNPLIEHAPLALVEK
jgi:hypothetical protein